MSALTSTRSVASPLLLVAAILAGLSLGPAPLAAQAIQPSRGADQRVDYRRLASLGPWDDRNYQLTREDLELLAPNEDELSDPIPAFFRVQLRREWPELRRSGPAQYPRSALQIFRQLHGGYQIDGRIYQRVRRVAGRFEVIMDEPDRGIPEPYFLSGEARVTNPAGAAESAIKIRPTDTNWVIAGSNGPGSGQKMHYSTDGGVLWNAAAALPQGGTCCDPTVDWKSDGTLAYTATLGNCGGSGCAIWFYRSSDGGMTWNGLESVTPGDPRRELTTSGSDKEFLHVDKHATSAHLDNLYLTWHDNNVMQFARSTDDGNSWSKTSFGADPQGIGSDITTDKSGNVYYFWPAFNSRQIVLKMSTDGGATFAAGTTTVASTQASFTFPVPSMDTREVFVYVAADADLSAGPYGGSVYAAWTDSTATTSSTAANNHARVQVAYSRDAGATWSVVTPHETADAAMVDRYHPWLAVGPDGTVHVVFYDTRRSAGRTSVDLFYSSSADGAQTFSTPIRLTSIASPKINDSFEFGDYNGLDAVMADIIAIYTDNRSEAGGGGDSVDVYAAGLAATGVPQVAISSPADGARYGVGSAIPFAATASDAEDGDLTAGLAWSSDVDGAIGAGGSFAAALTPGAHTVTAEVADSSSTPGSAAVDVHVVAAPGGGSGGDCAPSLDEEFEGGAPGWTASGLWHLADASACAPPGYSSPTHAFYYGQDAGCDYDTGAATSGDLISPAFAGLTADSSLTFDFFRQVESSVNDPYDFTRVAVSEVGQPTWTEVWSKSSFDASAAAWTSSGPISLAAFAGQTVQLRFRFDSTDQISNEFVGWLIDDVRVSNGSGSSDDLLLTGQTVSDTQSWTSCSSIRAGHGYEIATPGDVRLEAPLVILDNDTSVLGDGGLTAAN